MSDIKFRDTGFCPHGKQTGQCDACRFEYLKEIKGPAKNNYQKAIDSFGLKRSALYTEIYNKMETMNHGPYHPEGDPNTHISLVLFEMDKIIAGEDKSNNSFTPEEKNILRLSAILHDVGKPESCFVDIPTKKHLELFKESKQELKPEVLAQAEKIRSSILEEMSPGKRSKTKEMELVRTKEFQEKIQARLENEDAEVKRAFVPRFFDHETFSVQQVDTIVKEAGLDLSEDQKEILKKIIGNHMALYADSVGINKLIEKVLIKDGKFDERLWKMLKAQVRSDSRGTYAFGEPDRDANVDRLITEIEKIKNNL